MEQTNLIASEPQPLSKKPDISKTDLPLLPELVKQLEFKNQDEIDDEIPSKMFLIEFFKQKSLLKRLIVTSCKEIFSRSTVHGFPSFASDYIVWPLKLFWLLLMGLSWSFFIYQSISTAALYNSHPKVTRISTNRELTVDFPAVDICNLNPYNGVFSRNSIQDVLQEKSIYPNTSASAKSYTENTSNQIKSLFDYGWRNGTFDLFWASYYIYEIIKDCKYQGSKCQYTDFYWYHNYHYGNCYRFNGGAGLENQTRRDGSFTSYSNKKAYKTGNQNGLSLLLYAGDQSTQLQFVYKTGFRVIIHNQTIATFPDQDGIDVPAGTETNIGIKRKFLYRLPSPYSNCIDQLTQDVAKQNDILQIMYEQIQTNQLKQYQANYCMAICYQKYIVKSCKCMALSLASLNVTFYGQDGNQITGCFHTEDVNCMITADKVFYNSEAVNECYSLCPNECNLMSYDVSIRQAIFPNQWYSRQSTGFQYSDFGNSTAIYLYNASVFDTIQGSGVVLNIFYESFNYEVVQETPQYTSDYLLGNIGGNLSLFTGMSFLSFVELLELILSSSVILLCFKSLSVHPSFD